MEYLSEVSKLANEKVPTPFEGGICRGGNVFKAMALGTSAIYVGRLQLWRFSVFDQRGVERVIEVLQTEFRFTMQPMGAVNIAAINVAVVYKESGISSAPNAALFIQIKLSA